MGASESSFEGRTIEPRFPVSATGYTTTFPPDHATESSFPVRITEYSSSFPIQTTRSSFPVRTISYSSFPVYEDRSTFPVSAHAIANGSSSKSPAFESYRFSLPVSGSSLAANTNDSSLGYYGKSVSPNGNTSGIVKTFHSSARWKEHFDSVKETYKLMVIDFTATWCGPCRSMAPVFTDLAAKYTDVEFIKIDVDQLDDVARKYEVVAMPTFLLMKKGKVVDKVVGAKKDELQTKIQQHR